MALIPLPNPARFKNVKWALEQPAQVNRSPYSGARKVTALGGSIWRVEADVVPITREAKVRPWRAFLAALRGQVHTFQMPAYNIVAPPIATATVSGGVAGTTVISRSTSGTLLAGTYMTLPLVGGGTQLVVLTADSTGTNALSFAPALRKDAAGTAQLAAPYAEVALIDSSFEILGSEGQGFAVSFAAEEAF